MEGRNANVKWQETSAIRTNHGIDSGSGSSPEKSPINKSRYGRTQKPKIKQDYFNLDDIIPDYTEDTPRPTRSINNPYKVVSVKKSPRKQSPTKFKVTKVSRKSSPTFAHVTGDIEEKITIKSPVILPRNNNDNGTIKRKFFKRQSNQSEEALSNINKRNDPYIDLSESGIDQVFKIISKPTPDRLFDSEIKTRPTLKTYGNKRKRYNSGVVESFGLPDIPIFPTESDSPINEPKRIKKIDLKICSENEVNLVDKKLLDTPWEIAETANNTSAAATDLQLILAAEQTHKVGVGKSKRKPSSDTIQRKSEKYSPRKTRSSRDLSADSLVKTSSDSGVESGEVEQIVRVKVKTNRRTSPVSKATNSPKSLATTLLHTDDPVELPPEIPTTEIKEEPTDPPVDELDLQEEEISEFDLGDLVWARIGSYPFWPSVTTMDKSTNTFKRPAGTKKGNVMEYHVRFFGDNGRRSWVIGTSLLFFCNANDLQQFSVKFKASKSSKLRACSVKRYLLPKWKTAVKEAQTMLEKTPDERIEFFDNFKVEKRKSSIRPKPQVATKPADETPSANPIPVAEKEPDVDTVSECSSSGSSISPYREQVELFSRLNLFRGMPRKKCCQICLKSGKVSKCLGRCEGYYHYECSMQLGNVQNDIVQEQQREAYDTIVISDESDCETPNVTVSLSLADQIDEKMKEVMKKVSSKYAVSDEEEGSSASTNHTFTCFYCAESKVPPCFICNKEETRREMCSLKKCANYYHPSCVKKWPQTQWSFTNTPEKLDTFVCPAHVCHTCAVDDPQAEPRCTNDKVVKCVKCPSTYHSSNYCLPAGTLILSTSQVVCPRHFTATTRQRILPHINATWCFVCSQGGSLICCEMCPTSVHRDCADIDFQEDGTFLCEDCEIGRFPLYDEVVWAKLGQYRWWPSVILFPSEVPANVNSVPHNDGDFVVEFLETHDYAWMHRGRVFIFDDGDKMYKSKSKGRFDIAFNKAVEEAAQLHKVKKEFRIQKLEEINQWIQPPHYVTIKVNKPIGNLRQFNGSVSNATACDCDPLHPFPCGPDTDCINRLLLTECNPDICPAARRCKNQRFEKREYPPLKPYKTLARGWGLKTLAPIREGDFVIEYVGEVIDEQEYQRRIRKMQQQKDENYYFLTLDRDRVIDAGPKGNVARFMNHSCQPNCETQKWTVNGETRVGLFALTDIPANSEITFNYNLECIGDRKKVCKCDGANCTGFIGAKTKQDDGIKKKKSMGAKKRSTVQQVPVGGPCFICQKDGGVISCQNKICSKFYHVECVGLEKIPEARWTCPSHNCNICEKRTIRSCTFCINSYCPSHSNGFVRHDKFLGFVCSTHDPDKSNKSNSSIDSNVENVPGNVKNKDTSTTIEKSVKVDFEELENVLCVDNRVRTLRSESTKGKTDKTKKTSKNVKKSPSTRKTKANKDVAHSRSLRSSTTPQKSENQVLTQRRRTENDQVAIGRRLRSHEH